MPSPLLVTEERPETMPPSPLPWAKVTGESSLTGSPVASSRVAVIVQLEPEVRVAPRSCR